MKAHWSAVFCALFIFAGLGNSDLRAQESTIQPAVLHMQKSTTTARPNFPTFLGMYQVADGANVVWSTSLQPVSANPTSKNNTALILTTDH